MIIPDIPLIWQSLPEDFKRYLVSAAAGLTGPVLSGLKLGNKAEKAFQQAVIDGFTCFMSAFGSHLHGSFLQNKLLQRPEIQLFFRKVIEEGEKKSTQPLETILADFGIETASLEGFDLTQAVELFFDGFVNSASFSKELEPYVRTRHWLETRRQRQLSEKPSVDFDALQAQYYEFLRQEFSHIKLKGIIKGILKPIPLSQIYTELVFARETPERQTVLPRKGKKQNEAAFEVAAKERSAAIPDLLQSRYAVITGGPGTGKSTLLKRLALAYAEGDYLEKLGLTEQRLPIFLPIVHYARHCRKAAETGNPQITLKDFLPVFYQQLRRVDTDLGPLFEKYLEKGEALILLDGLDEVINEAERYHMVEAVRRFIQDSRHHPDNRYFVTCRTASYTTATRFEAIDGHDFTHLHVQSFSREMIKSFLLAWYRWYEREINTRPDAEEAAATSCSRMLGIVIGDKHLEEIASNPLMLTILVNIEHDAGGELPRTRAALYGECLVKLAGAWDRFRTELTLAPDPDRQQQWKLERYEINDGFIVEHLGPVALDMQKKAALELDEDELRQKLAVNLLPRAGNDRTLARQYADNFIMILREKSGLMQATTVCVFEFIHPTFREYLASRWLADWSEDIMAAIGGHLLTPEWREVVSLTAATLKPRQAGLFLNSILEQGKLHPENVNLVGSVLADIGEDKVPPPVVTRLLERLAEVGFGDYSPPLKAAAAESLGWLGDKRLLEDEFVLIGAGKCLIKKLSSQVFEVAAFELGKYPVTNRWFSEFVEAGGYVDEWLRKAVWSPEGQRWLVYSKTKAPAFWHDRKWRCHTAPVVGVCWYEADAFCRWLTGIKGNGFSYRLPTEQEWQVAAAGQDQREFPWGNDEKIQCNISESKVGKTSAVGIFAGSDTPDTKISDLAGNVWEWTGTGYHDGKVLDDFSFDQKMQRLIDAGKLEEWIVKLKEKDRQLPVLRGGSWLINREDARCSIRLGLNPDLRGDDVGFRCARTK